MGPPGNEPREHGEVTMDELKTTAFQIMFTLGTGVIALALLGVIGFGG